MSSKQTPGNRFGMDQLNDFSSSSSDSSSNSSSGSRSIIGALGYDNNDSSISVSSSGSENSIDEHHSWSIVGDEKESESSESSSSDGEELLDEELPKEELDEGDSANSDSEDVEECSSSSMLAQCPSSIAHRHNKYSCSTASQASCSTGLSLSASDSISISGDSKSVLRLPNSNGSEDSASGVGSSTKGGNADYSKSRVATSSMATQCPSSRAFDNNSSSSEMKPSSSASNKSNARSLNSQLALLEELEKQSAPSSLAVVVRQQLKQKVKQALEEDDMQEKEEKVCTQFLADLVKEEFKQRVSHMLEEEGWSSEKKESESVFNPKLYSPPSSNCSEDSSIVGKRFCVTCFIGEVCVVPVNGGKHKRWQCTNLSCKEWYEWCPIVYPNPTTPKMERLLETGGWEEKPSLNKVREDKNKKVVEKNSDSALKASTPSPKIVAKPDAPTSTPSWVLLVVFSLLLMIAAGYLLSAYFGEMNVSALLAQQVAQLQHQLETAKWESSIFAASHQKIGDNISPSNIDLSRFSGKLHLLFSSLANLTTDYFFQLVQSIVGQLKHYSYVDVFLLLFSLNTVIVFTLSLAMAVLSSANHYMMNAAGWLERRLMGLLRRVR